MNYYNTLIESKTKIFLFHFSSDFDSGNGKISGTQRDCIAFPEGSKDGDCGQATVGDVTAEFCFCNSELCNSAGKFNYSIITISILIFLTFSMKQKLNELRGRLDWYFFMVNFENQRFGDYTSSFNSYDPLHTVLNLLLPYHFLNEGTHVHVIVKYFPHFL